MFSIRLPADYLSKLELGDFMESYMSVFQHSFASTFGSVFGKELMSLTRSMLSIDPLSRPEPAYILGKLSGLAYT